MSTHKQNKLRLLTKSKLSLNLEMFVITFKTMQEMLQMFTQQCCLVQDMQYIELMTTKMLTKNVQKQNKLNIHDDLITC